MYFMQCYLFFFFEILAENIEMWDKQVEDEKVNWIFSWMSLRNRRVLSQQLWPESASELVISVPHCVSLFFVKSENKTTFSSCLWSISFGKEDGDHFVRTGELLWLLSGKWSNRYSFNDFLDWRWWNLIYTKNSMISKFRTSCLSQTTVWSVSSCRRGAQ